MGKSSTPGARAGRRRATSRAELEHVAFELFAERGFERTTVDDVAAAAGIGRRTFFRYFASKNDIPWGDFAGQLDAMRARLAAAPDDVPLMDAVRQALLDFNRVPEAELPWHRRRMRLILGVPALQAHSTLRYADWRQALAEFVGRRLGQPADALAPQAIAHATLGVAVAAYEQWLRADPDGATAASDRADADATVAATDSAEDAATDLQALLDAGMRHLAASFAATVTPVEP